MSTYLCQNELLMGNLINYYNNDNYRNLDRILPIINGESKVSLRIIDWFSTNYAKKHFVVYSLVNNAGDPTRFKVYMDYKLKLKSYSKKRFDPFCRWERITFPYKNNSMIQTTLGQLNFFKWALENKVIDYLDNNYSDIENDMNNRNSTAKNKTNDNTKGNKTRKKREELSISASKSIKKENVEVIVKFG